MAGIIYFADRRGEEPDVEQFRQQIADRRAFHDEFELNMRRAFEVVKDRNPGVMGHMGSEEFEDWLADRIRKRGRMRATRRRRQNIALGTITTQPAAHSSFSCASVACSSVETRL